MRPGSVEVVHIRVEHAVELLLMQDEQMIEALTPYTAEESLTDSIRAWGCTGYLVHLFGKSHRKIDRAYLHSLQIDVQPGKICV
jgi:hypothetical protein